MAVRGGGLDDRWIFTEIYRHGRMDGANDRVIDGWMEREMDGWMDGENDIKIDGWIEKEMDG